MNEEIPCITNKGKTVKNEWEKDDSDFLLALYSVSKKLGHFFFHNLLTNSFKRSSVTSYKYLSKLTLNVPVPDKVKKLSEIFIFTLLCGASKGFMKALRHHKEVWK